MVAVEARNHLPLLNCVAFIYGSLDQAPGSLECDIHLGQLDIAGDREDDVPGVATVSFGDYEMARQCIDLGFYISVPGVVTFDKAKTIQDVVQRSPLSSILLETDAPYLAPVPHRGKRNEPSFIVNTAKKVAEIKKIPWEEVAQATACNAMNLFGIKTSRIH